MKVIWTPKAEKSLVEVVEFLTEHWGIKAARSFVLLTEDLTDKLSRFPELGPVEDEEKGIRGILLTPHNRLFYRIKGEAVVILSVFDTRSERPKF
jgi:plasmid stabilization system protein ParE